MSEVNLLNKEEQMANELRYFDLNTGAKIPSVGLGTWQSPPGEVYNAVITAVEVNSNPILFIHSTGSA